MSGKNIISARMLAFQVLQDVFGEGAYANIALSKRLKPAIRQAFFMGLSTSCDPLRCMNQSLREIERLRR